MLVSKSDRPYASLAELLASARQRIAAFAKHNEGEVFGNSHSLAFLYTYIAVLGLSACAWLAVFFLRGDLRLWAMGFAVLSSLAGWIMAKVEKCTERRANAAAEVALAAYVQGLDPIHAPDDGEDETVYPSFVVVTRDPAMERDPDRLIDLADRLGDLRATALAEVPDELREVRVFLDSEDRPDYSEWYLIPESFAGGGPTWLTICAFDRERLPHRFVDRPLWLVLYHRDHPSDVATTTLAKELWYSEQNEHLFYPSGGRGEPAQDVG